MQDNTKLVEEITDKITVIEELLKQQRQELSPKDFLRYVNGVGVDAGIIAFASKSVFEAFDPNATFDESLIKIIEVPPGLYKVEYDIPDTWNGRCEGKGYLNIPDGKLIISDPCYIIGHTHDDTGNDLWSKFLKLTYYAYVPLHNMMLCGDMGGDGCYNIQVHLREVKI